MTDEIDSSESDDLEDCMKVFLSGLSISDLSWQNAEDVEPTTPEGPQPLCKLVERHPTILRSVTQLNVGEIEAESNEEWWICSCSNVPDLRPPNHLLQIVDHSMLGRGFALIAKQFIPAGTILYTERALFASQVPENIISSTDHIRLCADRYQASLYKVRACQQCFRSLEPISSCSTISPSKNIEDPSFRSPFPLPHLYPIPDFQWDYSSDQTDALFYYTDRYGRVACSQCKTLFCSHSCYNSFLHQYNSCCSMFKTMQHLPYLLRQPILTSREISQQNITDKCKTGDDNDDNVVSIQPAIPLAIRMFVAMLQWYRVSRGSSNVVFPGSLPNIINVLCGKSSNIQALELGIPQLDRATDKDDRNSSSIFVYTLEPIYMHLCNVYSITRLEQQSMFSLEYFMSVTAKAAQNGFGLRTQSPFQTYYAAIVRSAYSRESDAHKQMQHKMAKALGSASGSFERGMDQRVNDRVSPEIVAFYPLTSRINHSCIPNAQVRSQQFVDSYIDLVATSGIAIGTEICISYIHIGRKGTLRRQRELYAKYLFHCTCASCVPTHSV